MLKYLKNCFSQVWNKCRGDRPKTLQGLVNKCAGTGRRASSSAAVDLGEPGDKEFVDFEEVIGYVIDIDTQVKIPTTWGIINYEKEGVYVVPVIEPNCDKRRLAIDFVIQCLKLGLYGEVTPEVRAVQLAYTNGSLESGVWLYYDGPVSEKTLSYWDCITNEIDAHMGVDCASFLYIERLDYPSPIPHKGRYVYLRYEEGQEYGDIFNKAKVTNETVTKEVSDQAFPMNHRRIVDFGEPIGHAIDRRTLQPVETQIGLVHGLGESSHIILVNPSVIAKTEKYPLTYWVLSTVNALLGVVTTELRAVTVKRLEDDVFQVFFYYSEDPGEKIRNLWEMAYSEICADMGSLEMMRVEMVQLSPKETIPAFDEVAYVRNDGMVEE